MADQLKAEHADCPKCGQKTSDFNSMGSPKQWECLHCKAGGFISKPGAGAPASAPVKKVHKHWSAR
jgi:ribosomal protein L37AE/L43A